MKYHTISRFSSRCCDAHYNFHIKAALRDNRDISMIIVNQSAGYAGGIGNLEVWIDDESIIDALIESLSKAKSYLASHGSNLRKRNTVTMKGKKNAS